MRDQGNCMEDKPVEYSGRNNRLNPKKTFCFVDVAAFAFPEIDVSL
jgi:hypothetical protein